MATAKKRSSPFNAFQVILYAVLLIALLAAGFLFSIDKTIDRDYAEWEVAELMIDYVRDQDEWPKAWSDLKPYYNPSSSRVAGEPFEYLENSVNVNFSHSLATATAVARRGTPGDPPLISQKQILFLVQGGGNGRQMLTSFLARR